MNIYYGNIYRPGGNDTCLLFGQKPKEDLAKQINDLVMAKYPNVEQVGFITSNQDSYVLDMAGSEFCGNATRSAVSYFLDNKPGSIKINVSGTNKSLSSGIDNYGNVWAQMPLPRASNRLQVINGNISVAYLEGITNIVVRVEKLFLDKETAIQKAQQYIEQYQTIDSPAIGVMFYEDKDKYVELQPVVWVKSIDTLFYETACGSGTAAVGMAFAWKEYRSIADLSIKQPSGSLIQTSVNIRGNSIISASISGKVDILKENIQINLDK